MRSAGIEEMVQTSCQGEAHRSPAWKGDAILSHSPILWMISGISTAVNLEKTPTFDC